MSSLNQKYEIILESKINKNPPLIPKISVIIPLYNKAPYIKNALDSILRQTIQDFEVIVIGGNSSDGGEDIVKGYTDSRIHLIKETGKGVSAARNQGINVAKAELIAFLDADDEWLPNYLDTILELRAKYPSAGIYSTPVYYTYDGKKEKIIPQKSFGIPEKWDGVVSDIFKCAAIDGVFPGYTSSTCVPKSVLMKIGGFEEGVQLFEDRDCWAKIALEYQYAHNSRPLVRYRYGNPTSLTNTAVDLKDSSFISTVERYRKEGKVTYVSLEDDNLKLFIASTYLTRAMSYSAMGDKKKVKELLQHAPQKKFIIRKIRILCGLYLPKKIVIFLAKIYLGFRQLL